MTPLICIEDWWITFIIANITSAGKRLTRYAGHGVEHTWVLEVVPKCQGILPLQFVHEPFACGTATRHSCSATRPRSPAPSGRCSGKLGWRSTRARTGAGRTARSGPGGPPPSPPPRASVGPQVVADHEHLPGRAPQQAAQEHQEQGRVQGPEVRHEPDRAVVRDGRDSGSPGCEGRARPW